MEENPLTLSLCFLLFISTAVVPSLSALQPNDTEALTAFRLQTDTHGNLRSNWTASSDPCSPSSPWLGVECSPAVGGGHRVISLSLPSLSLRGPIESLSFLDQLRHLDLHDNRLNGTLSPLSNCSNLKLLYLAGNDFSGEIPPQISSLHRLLRLDLSDNNIRGQIPRGLANLTKLLTLRLENNELSGQIPDLSASIPSLKELNLSNNELYGRVPEYMGKKFGYSSLAGNQGLCGFTPLPICSKFIPGPGDVTVPSNPSSIMPQSPIVESRSSQPPRRRGLTTGGMVAIIIAICVIFLVVASFTVAYCCGGGDRGGVGSGGRSSKVGSETGSAGKRRRSGSSTVVGGDSDGTSATDRSKLVFYDRKNQFELEDLLKASAEMLGKGSLGTVYRAVLDDGCTVAVKRLKDANPCARKEFEQYMEVIGKLKHPNIVRFKAYYYAKEEKLLVYDYLPNGSLHWLLHGNRGPGRIPLDWTTRISLVLGAARGLAKIHEEYGSARIPHGNIKSSNVLLDKNGVACIADFGLSLLLNPVHAIARIGGYRAPEQVETKRLSQKADVYSFGVLLLEVLTGQAPSQSHHHHHHHQYPSPSPAREREEEEEEQAAVDLPKWVRSVVKEEWTAEVFDQELLRYKNIEEELVSMLHVALACVAPAPEKRPEMGDVVRMIEEIRVEQSPLGEDYDESRNSMSPSLATTED
ncbi:Leucine-rich repeat receptor-like protein kinase PXC1 [Linum grandiflorum]